MTRLYQAWISIEAWLETTFSEDQKDMIGCGAMLLFLAVMAVIFGGETI